MAMAAAMVVATAAVRDAATVVATAAEQVAEQVADVALVTPEQLRLLKHQPTKLLPRKCLLLKLLRLKFLLHQLSIPRPSFPALGSSRPAPFDS